MKRLLSTAFAAVPLSSPVQAHNWTFKKNQRMEQPKFHFPCGDQKVPRPAFSGDAHVHPSLFVGRSPIGNISELDTALRLAQSEKFH